MTARRVATAKDGKKTSVEEQLRRVTAFRNVFGGNGNREDADIVLSHLCKTFEFFEPPSLAEWMKKTGSPVGYELNCALHASRCEPIRTIINHMDLGDDMMLALEKAAREARS